jgi:hypothetical protein
MFSSEPVHAQPSTRTSTRPVSQTAKSVRQDRFLTDEALQVDALIRELMPENVSANKQAVIEQLIRLWKTKPGVDAA